MHPSPPHPSKALPKRIPGLHIAHPVAAEPLDRHPQRQLKTPPVPVLGYSGKQIDRITASRKQLARHYAQQHHFPQVVVPHPQTPATQLRHIRNEQLKNQASYANVINPLSHENLGFDAKFLKSLGPQSISDIAHGHMPSAKHLGTDALFFLPVSRAGRAVFEASRAAKAYEATSEAGRGAGLLAQTGERAAAGGRAAKQSYKAGHGILGGLGSAGKRLLPSERALRASAARKQLFAHLDATLEPRAARAEKQLFDKAVKAGARNIGVSTHDMVHRLLHVRSEIAPHEIPQELKGLYQHEALPVPHMPEQLDAKAIAKEIRATHGKDLPPQLRKPGALERAINRTYEHVKLGAGYRDWYKRYAAVMAKTAEHSAFGHVSPRQVAQLMAVYSQRARPTENYRRAIMSALQHGDFEVFGGQRDKAMKIIKDPNWFEREYLPSQDGPKISNYYANALEHLDPAHYQKLFAGSPAHVTVDTHMNQMLLGTDRVQNKHYDSLAQVFRVMSKHLGPEWAPHEVQAASWVSKKAANEASLTAQKMIAKGVKFAQRPASEYLHSSGDAYERAYEKYAGTLFQGGPLDRSLNAIDRYGHREPWDHELGNPWYDIGPNPQAAGADMVSRDVARGISKARELLRGKGFTQHIIDTHSGHDLEGLPSKIKVNGKSVEWHSYGPAQDLASSYMEKSGLPYHPPATYAKVDPERAKRIAEWYDQAQHAPLDPEVKQAYDAMARETLAQYHDIVGKGYKFEFYPHGVDPYPHGPRQAILDLIQNKHMYVFPTEAGFGSDVPEGSVRLYRGEQLASEEGQGGRTGGRWFTTDKDYAKQYAANGRLLHVDLPKEVAAQHLTGTLKHPPGGVDMWHPDASSEFHLPPEHAAKAVLSTADHPLLEWSGELWNGQKVTHNDIFRAVHDFFGHAKEGVGFRADGEENAWRSHSAMYSPEARKAMTSETRGQNSWVNFGPHGEANRTANQLDTVYADQKAVVAPDWVVHDGAGDETNVLHQDFKEPPKSAGEVAIQATQRAGTAVKGAFEHVEAAHGGIIHLTKAADVTTFPHEMAHFLRRYGLNADHEARLAEWAGVKNGVWDRPAEEKFARGLEKMIRQGDAPNNMVEEFKRLEPLFREVYPEAGHPLPTVPADIAQVYKEILGHRDGPQALYYMLHNRLVAHSLADEARQGPERSPEEAHQHVLDASALAAEEGHGRDLPPIEKLKDLETSVSTGGKAGLELRRAMRDVPKLRNEQEAVREVQRSRKASALRADQQAALTAEHPSEALTTAGGTRAGLLEHTGFEGFHGLRDYLDDLATHLIQHPNLKPFETQNAWDAILNGIEGQVPRKYEQKLLERAFGKEQESIAQQLKNGTFGEKVANIFNIPRSFMAAGDLSAPFRQGLMLLAHRPSTFFKNYIPMFRDTFSEAKYQETMQGIRDMPTHPLAEKAGVAFTKAGAKISQREEQYASDMAEHLGELPVINKIPRKINPAVGASHIVRGSDRGYTAFLDKSRADEFDSLVHQAAELGYHLDGPHGEKLLSDIAKFVNSATGRGDLGKLADHAATLNMAFFSPRLLKSRLDFLNPVWYMRMEPFARQQALRSAVRLAVTLNTILLFARAAGATVVADPRNADFGKIRIGDTRLDIAGGFTQPLRLIAQLWTGQIVSSQTGRVENLTSTGFGRSRLDVASQFLENKAAPVPGTIVDLLRGSQFGGTPVTAQSELEQHMIPLLWQDMHDVYKSTGLKGLAAYGPADLFGVGVQNYGAPGPKTKQNLSKLEQETQDAGLGKIPASVQKDVKWKSELDAATYSGQDSYGKATAAAKLFDQRYGAHVEAILPHLHTQGQAEALYQELRPKLFPALEQWQSAVNKVLRAKSAEKLTPQAQAEKKSSAPATGVAVTDAQQASYHIPSDRNAKLGAHDLPAAHGLPPELGNAIQRAAAKYGVPASTLAGIWRIESGSTYPNPAKNSLGYGGLFGTKKWNASTQEQADYAAQTLSHLLHENGGNMAAALSKYSGGGYTSVSGAGGGWHAGGSVSGIDTRYSGPMVANGGGSVATGNHLTQMADTVLESLASGNYNPIRVFTALSSQRLQNTMEIPGGAGHIRFQIPKFSGPVGRAARGAIALAQAYLGTPYVWGGESPRGFDCSGLLQYIYEKQGVNIPRTSQEQFRAGTPVAKSQLRPGDAVFFEGGPGGPGHVGIYIGHGKFIEAPHTGATVRISNLAGYPGYVGARRYARAGRRGRKAA